MLSQSRRYLLFLILVFFFIVLNFFLCSPVQASVTARVYYGYESSNRLARYVLYDPTHQTATCMRFGEGISTEQTNQNEADCIQGFIFPVQPINPSQTPQNTFFEALVLLVWTDIVSFGFFCLVLFCFVQMLPS